jgi:hypothetical protein
MNKRAVRRTNAELLEWLQPLFQEFNRRFFDGMLPAYEVRVDLLIDGKTIIRLPSGGHWQLPNFGNDLHGLCLANEHLIIIDSRCSSLEDEWTREVLLHEMCHAAVHRTAPAVAGGDSHGQEFVAELRRLAALGEAWAGQEEMYYRTVPPDHQAKCPLDTWRLGHSS